MTRTSAGILLYRRRDGRRIDVFLVHPGGQNAGQWLFVEEHTGMPITEAVAETLLELIG